MVILGICGCLSGYIICWATPTPSSSLLMNRGTTYAEPLPWFMIAKYYDTW